MLLGLNLEVSLPTMICVQMASQHFPIRRGNVSFGISLAATPYVKVMFQTLLKSPEKQPKQEKLIR